jgi:hypothetical protein
LATDSTNNRRSSSNVSSNTICRSQILSKDLFESQEYSLIQDWELTTINRFLCTFDLIRTNTQGDQLMNKQNSYIIMNATWRNSAIEFRTYKDCLYALSQSCRTPMHIYNNITYWISDPTYEVPNLFIGCYLIEALFASTLECFYNLSCLLKLDKYIYQMVQPFNFSPLNMALNQPNETIE